MPNLLPPDEVKALLNDLVADLPDGQADLEDGRRLVLRSRRRSQRRQRALAAIITAVAAATAVVFVVPRLQFREPGVASNSPHHPAQVAPAASSPSTPQDVVDVGDLDGDGSSDRVVLEDVDGTWLLRLDTPGAEGAPLDESVERWRVVPAGDVDGRPGTEFFVTGSRPGNSASTMVYLYTLVGDSLQAVRMDGAPFLVMVSRTPEADAERTLASGFTCNSAGLKMETVSSETTYTRISTLYAWDGPGEVRQGVPSRQDYQSLTASQIDKIGTGTCGSANITPPS